MKRIILILFFLFKFLFSSEDYYMVFGSEVFRVTAYTPLETTSYCRFENTSGNYYIYDSNYKYSSSSALKIGTANIDCLKTYFPDYVCLLDGYEGMYLYHDDITYCLYKSGYDWSSVLKAWVNTSTNEILCPDGQTYNSSTGSCIYNLYDYNLNPITVCPEGYVIYTNDSGQNICMTLDDVLNFLPDLDGCYYDTYSDGTKKIMTISVDTTQKCYATLICGSSTYSIPVNCVDYDPSASNTNSLPGDSNITCSSDQVIVINPDTGDVSCESVNYTSDNNTTTSTEINTSSTSSDTNTTTSDSSSSSTSNDSNSSSNSGSSASNNNTCPDPCYLYYHKPMGFQFSTSTVDGYTCNTVTYPVYKNCNVQYYIKDGKCISGCGNNVASGSSGDNNISINLSPLTSRIDKTNEKLDEINQKLDDFKSMTPDSNFSVEGSVDSDIESFFNTYKDFFNNIGSDLENIKGSFDSVKSMLKKDQYSLSLPSDIYQCPLTITLYKTTQSIDICKFISPYRPLLQIFFTLFFNISVLAFFFKVIINRGEK